SSPIRSFGVASKHHGADTDAASASSPSRSRPGRPPLSSRQNTIEGIRGNPSTSTSSTRPPTPNAAAVDVVPKSIARTQPAIKPLTPTPIPENSQTPTRPYPRPTTPTSPAHQPTREPAAASPPAPPTPGPPVPLPGGPRPQVLTVRERSAPDGAGRPFPAPPARGSPPVRR